jgi:hypothetical protein
LLCCGCCYRPDRGGLYVRAGTGRVAGPAVNAIKWNRVFAVVVFAALTLMFVLGCVVGALVWRLI